MAIPPEDDEEPKIPRSPPPPSRLWGRDYEDWEEAEAEAQRQHEEELEADRKEAALQEMADWFFVHFEDPQNETPYDNEDGEYQYIWGGPFSANEVVGDQFGHNYKQSWIDEAVKRIEKDGTYEWAPTSSGDYYEHPEVDEDRTEHRLVISERVLARLDELQRQLEEIPPSLPSIGHNNPPGEIGLPPYDAAARNELEEAALVTRREVTSSEPDPEALAQAQRTFRKIAGAIVRWVGQKLDLAVDESIKAGVKAIAWATVASVILGLADDIAQLLEIMS